MTETPNDSIPPIRAEVVTEAVQGSGRESPPQPPARVVEFLLLLAVVLICDLTIYRGRGYAGVAFAFSTLPILFWFAAPRRLGGSGQWLIGVMLLLAAGKLLWCGSALLVTCGSLLLVAFAMTLSGLCPYALATIVFGSQAVMAGYEGMLFYGKWLIGGRVVVEKVKRYRWLNVLLPAITCLLFAGLFVLANPNLLAAFGETWRTVLEWLRYQLFEIIPEPLQAIFWVAVFWISVGLLRPVIRPDSRAEAELLPASKPSAPAPLYLAFRNTLATVIVLFAVYLVFEFTTLWFREFPVGFYYSGYAHEGAAWLTVALALATLILSLIFRGSIFRDERIGVLRRLAWIWSSQNLLLALAVYNRLFIYIGFNGMSRMRMVGLFGMTAVVAGLLLVLWKISRQKNFVWLIRRQLWALGLTIFLFSLTPVDTIVVAHNVRRILNGDPAPAVQISVQPIGAEGIPGLLPLIQCRNPRIRDGVRAILAERYERALVARHRRQRRGWTAVQLAEDHALHRLRQKQADFATEYQDPAKRTTAKQAFDNYVYQWY